VYIWSFITVSSIVCNVKRMETPYIYRVFQKTAQSLMHRNRTTVLLAVIHLSVAVLLFS